MGKVIDRGWKDQSGQDTSEPYKIVSVPNTKKGSKKPSSLPYDPHRTPVRDMCLRSLRGSSLFFRGGFFKGGGVVG